MKTFAEMLNDPARPFTQDMRDAVEACHIAMNDWQDDNDPNTEWPLNVMRSTPPAKEPVSVECCVSKVEEASGGAVYVTALLASRSMEIKEGDRVRVVKIKEPT